MDWWLDLAQRLPAIAAAWGDMFRSSWTVDGILAIIAAFNYGFYLSANRALLAEKDKRIDDVNKTTLLADQMREVLAILGRKAADPPPPGPAGGA